MAEQNQDQDRSEEATPFKLREAKKRGQVAKSLEVNSLLALSLALLILVMMGESMFVDELALSKYLFSNSHAINFENINVVVFFESMIDSLVSIFWPMMFGFIVVGIIANMSQTGPIFSFFPLKPDIQRINPVSGFKRLFSLKLLFESFKSVVKLALFATVVYFFIVGSIPALLGLLDTGPEYYPVLLMGETTELMGKLILVLLIIAILDFAYTRKEFSKKMRMSRRDIKEEVKRREGDPHVRARQKELQREASKRSSSIARVPEADVIITNPTHLSVALLYKRGEMISPEVIAKGAGDLALKIREIARQHNVPIVENKKLARTLFKEVDINRAIPEEVFPVVAKILAWCFALRQGKITSQKLLVQG